jgi:anti-sigma factor RsiW
MNHCSSAQLQSYLDGRLRKDEEKLVTVHLQGCEQCKRAYEVVARIDAWLKRMPRESVSSGFTQSLMAKLHLAPKSSLLFRLLENVAYLFGLVIVLGTMVVVFILTGTVDTEQVSQTQGAVSEALSRIGDGVSVTLGAVTGWMHQLFPFAFAKGSMGITMFGMLVVLALAAVDWLVRRRYVHRF